MIFLLMNQAQKGHPITPEIASKQIGRPVFASIPKDDATCVQALNSSKPIMTIAKNSAFAKGTLECVKRIIQKNVLTGWFVFLERVAFLKVYICLVFINSLIFIKIYYIAGLCTLI